MKRSLPLAVAALALGFAAGSARAAEEPSEEQVALVREFLEVTETGGGVGPLRQVFVERIDRTYPQTFAQMLDELALDPAERADAEATYVESLGRFRGTFGRLFDEQIDLEALARVLYAPIYTRHLSDDDLRELTAFYRTPLGRKSLQALPLAMHQVTLEVGPAMAPLITSLVNEAVAIEKRALAK